MLASHTGGLADGAFEGREGGGVGESLAGGGGDAEGVYDGAFFGADAGVGDFESEAADGVEDGLEEADAVHCLNVHGGGEHGKVRLGVGAEFFLGTHGAEQREEQGED